MMTYTVIEYVAASHYSHIYLGRQSNAGMQVWQWRNGIGTMTNIHDIIAWLDAMWADDIMGRGHHMIDDHEVTDTLTPGAWEDICLRAIDTSEPRYWVIAGSAGDLRPPHGSGWIDIWPGRASVLGHKVLGIYSWPLDASPPASDGGLTYHAVEATIAWPHDITIYECSPPGTCRYIWRISTAYDGERVNIIDELAHYLCCGLYDTTSSSYYHRHPPIAVGGDKQAMYDAMIADDDETSRIIAYGAYIPDADPMDSYRIRIYPGIPGDISSGPRACNYCLVCHYCYGRPSA